MMDLLCVGGGSH